MAIYRGPGGSGDATTDATNQASVASDAAAAALASQTAAATSATNASTSATSAASSASSASTSATNAASSASTASTQASNASTSATNAASSASSASTSATNAASSATSAATTYDNFDDRYLGSKASAPTLDNDGNTLLVGALYWNSTNSTMYAWSGTAWTAISGGGGASGVSSFNTRTGAVTLSSSDVTTALTYTPPSTTGSGATGTWNIDILGSAGTVTNGVYTNGPQTIDGIKTFSSTIVGSISGNAATVTNGVYSNGSYSNPSWITALAGSKITGNISGNAGTVTNGFYTTSSFNLGTTSIAVNRASSAQTLTGVSIDGNAGTVTNGIYTTGSYSNPSWITSLAETKVLPSQTGNSGKYLTTNGTSTSWATVTGGGASALDDLTDVVITTPSTGQVLKYNGTNWINDTDATGSGSFTYPTAGIAVSTGSAWGTSLTDNSSNWNTAYTDRLKWDGGSTGLTASTGRTSLGATTVGSNLFTLTDPSAITFPRFNADNTVSALDASTFRTAIGAGTSSTNGTVTSVGLSVPTGFTVSNSPVTSSGTLGLIFSAGYSLPTTTSQSNWDTAYGWGNHASAGYALASNIGVTIQAYDSNLSSFVSTFTLPTTDGTNGQVLTTNGSGTLSFTTVSGGGGSMVYPSGSGIAVVSGGTSWGTTLTAPSGAIVGTTDTQTLSGKTLTGTKETVYTITDGAAFEINPANGGIQIITLGASRTPKGTNFTAGQSVTLMIDDGTAYTITWTDTTFGTSGVKWVGGLAPTLATTGYTIVELWMVGTQVYGSLVGNA